MNFQNVKQKLNKVNSFYAYLIENQEIVSRIDHDSFLDSIRSLYDACFEEAATTQTEKPNQQTPTPQKTKEVAKETKQQQSDTSKKRPKLVFNHQNVNKKAAGNSEKKTVQETPTAQQEKPVVQEKSVPKKEEKTPQKVEIPKEEKKQEVLPTTKPVDQSQVAKEQNEELNSDGFQEAYEPLFHYKAATDLSQKLSASKLDDLQKALGLNEKFLYINELFGGDVGQFQNTIKILNEGKNFNAARYYIEQNLITQNDWMNKTKRPVAKDFIKLVRRRYV